MPFPSSLRPPPDKKRDGGLAAVGLLVLVAGLGSWLAVVVMAALAWLWWGRPLGMAALFALAVSGAACVNAHRKPVSPPARPAAALVARPSSSG